MGREALGESQSTDTQIVPISAQDAISEADSLEKLAELIKAYNMKNGDEMLKRLLEIKNQNYAPQRLVSIFAKYENGVTRENGARDKWIELNDKMQHFR